MKDDRYGDYHLLRHRLTIQRVLPIVDIKEKGEAGHIHPSRLRALP